MKISEKNRHSHEKQSFNSFKNIESPGNKMHARIIISISYYISKKPFLAKMSLESFLFSPHMEPQQSKKTQTRVI